MNYNNDNIKEKRKEIRSKKTKKRNSILLGIAKALLVLILAFSVWGAAFAYGAYNGIQASAPEDINLTPQNSASILYDDAGKEIQELSDYSSNRIPVEFEQLPDNLKNAFIAIEDERFYEHNGVDFRGVLRAIWTDLTDGTVQGGSTITQQLIKNSVFNTGGERHKLAKVRRKIQEQYMAIREEKLHSKDWILTNYLNTINLGKGTLGVQAAANYYFNKDVEDLTLTECAVLASITKNPAMLNPVDYPESNKDRMELILQKMYSLNYITNEQYQEALKDDVYTRISENQEKKDTENIYSYFTDAVITQIVKDLEEQKGYTHEEAFNQVYRGGLRIYTTQNTKMQNIADNIINDADNYPVKTEYSLEYRLVVHHADDTDTTYTEKNLVRYFRKKNKDKDYDSLFSSKKNLEKAAKKFRKAKVKDGDVVAEEVIHYSLEPQLSYSLIDQTSGQVKVLVGGRGEKQDNLALNRATDMKRQPGSTFKPLAAYAPGLDSGEMTLATVFDDAPYKYESGVKVRNFERDKYRGLITVRDAIIDSNNIVAVKALTQITPRAGFDFLQKLGFTTLVDSRTNTDGALESDVNQSLSLGGITDGVTNVELTAAYAALANKGVYNRPILYTVVEDAYGNEILKNESSATQVMKDTTAWLLTDAMEDVVKRGTGQEAQLKSKMGVAGKTGTTSNNYDFWFAGYTPYYTASIWTGYDYNTSFDNEDDYHKVIWKKIMDKIISKTDQKVKGFGKCKGIEKSQICIKSGKLAVDHVCSNDPQKSMVRTEYFEAGTVPTDSCDTHVAVTLCAKSGRVVGKYCPKKHRYTRIFRIRPKNAKGTTEDSRYELTFNIDSYICDIHTEEWHEKQEQKKLEKKMQEEQEKMKQQTQPSTAAKKPTKKTR